MTKVTPSPLSRSQIFTMLRTTVTLLLFCLVGSTQGLYKQWIPNTNFENKTNWDKGDVPCGNDIIHFSAQARVSVFVETQHAVREMTLPIDGEFILSSGSGFNALSGKDPTCGTGVTARFKEQGTLRWFDPALWQAAATQSDLQHGNILFSVHEESVPCQHDDVVFKALSSFSVDTGSGHSVIPVKSVSVLGETYNSKPQFADYLSSHSGRLQFHGSSAVAVGNPGCEDPSGCDCGNSINHQLICNTVKCAILSCKKPLTPVGHCCEVCGTILTIQYTAGFNIQTYRQRISHLFLILPEYKSIRLGISKVLRSQILLGLIPFGTTPEIQVLILDEETGILTEALVQEIMKDIRSHGSKLGIANAEFLSSSGGSSDPSGGSAGVVVGIIFGVLTLMALVFVVALLVHKGLVPLPSMPSIPSIPSFWSRWMNSNAGDPSQTVTQGFDNPIFDRPEMLSPLPVLSGNDRQSVSMTQTGMHFTNPVYNENETDFSV